MNLGIIGYGNIGELLSQNIISPRQNTNNSTKYIIWFTTPYCHYDEKRKNCETENMLNIDFKQPPEKALNQIEKIVTSLQYY